MPINADQLAGHLRRGLAPVYLVHGDEPLLVREAGDAIRAAAAAAGFSERQVLTVDSGFDWDALYASAQNLSLFAERRLLELYLPTGRPGDAGAKFLEAFAQQPPTDTLLLVIAGKLEKPARESRWAKAIEAAGTSVAVYPVEAARLPGWIGHRLQARGLRPAAGVAELLAHHMEGNLLACEQEIEKLAMRFGAGAGHAKPVEIGVADIEGALSDNARFNIFGLADASLQGEARAVVRMLASLRAEGVEPVLVLWALTREAREMARLSTQLAAGAPLEKVLEANRVWSRRQPLVRQALKRLSSAAWLGILQRAARTDRVIKGRAAGDAWRELQALALAMSGLPTPGMQAAG